jgi:UDP-N-acetyl-2-amino-2-deoxyglucuronate dehydrogenase
LHDAHVRLALRVKAHAICEKPLVISPWNLDALEELEAEHGCRVYNVLQLRLVPSVLELAKKLKSETPRERAQIDLAYITRRGRWYDVSWKGSQEKSGGLALNIGIHFFDLLLWLFGGVERSSLQLLQPRKLAGTLELERARVRWFLSTDYEDLPVQIREKDGYAFRSMTIDGQEIEFSGGFKDLHTRVYEEVLAGRGAGLSDARPAIELVHAINHTEPQLNLRDAHPFVSQAAQSILPFARPAAKKAAA